MSKIIWLWLKLVTMLKTIHEIFYKSDQILLHHFTTHTHAHFRDLLILPQLILQIAKNNKPHLKIEFSMPLPLGISLKRRHSFCTW